MATKTQEVRPAGRRWTAVAVAVVVIAALGALGARSLARRSAVRAGLPPRPALGTLPAELGAELDGAEGAARSLLHSTDGLARLARLYHANGFYDEALQCYGTLRRLDPRNARWPHLEANILAQFGRQDDAIPLDQLAVKLDGGYLPGRLRLADELLRANRLAEAGEQYNQVLGLEADEPYALLGLSKIDVSNGAWDKARDRLERNAKLHPDFIGGLSLLVTVYEHDGRQADADTLKNTIGRREFVDLADPWLDSLSDDCFDSYRLSVAAAVADFSGNRAGAKQMLERAIAFAPKSSSFHRQLAIMQARDGALPDACDHLQRAVAINPQDNDAWLLLYQYLNMMGQTVSAQQALRSGLADCPQSAGLHLEEARRLNAAGRSEEAITEFREAFRLNPSEAGPLIQLAAVFFAVKRGDEGVAALKEALDKQPENPEALATLTYYYITSGDEAKALEWWGHVRRQPRTPPEMVQSLRQEFRQKFGRDLP